jgi:hypothetical protein
MSEQLWFLDRLDDGAAIDAIANVWATVKGWLDANAGGVTLVLLLLLTGGTYLLSVRRRTRT